MAHSPAGSGNEGGGGGGGTKKSWRSMTGGKARPAPDPGTSAESRASSEPAATTGGPKQRRFTAGRTAALERAASPRSYKLFAASLALALTLASLIGLFVWRVIDTRPHPLLAAWAVTDFKQSSVIPPNDFALEDLRLINHGKSQFAKTAIEPNMQRTDRFRAFFEDTLVNGTFTGDTLVVYVSTHGVSRGSEPILLTSESVGIEQGGYELKKVLEGMANCRVKNKLLVLDATRIDANLELGLLGNDFAFLLEREFKRIKSEFARKPADAGNFWVLCSSGDGETALASPSLGHSIFGLVFAYAAHGAPEADQADANGVKDGYLSARELVEFVKSRVSTWAEKARDKTTQTPFELKMGPDADFRLLALDADMTPQKFALIDRPPPPAAGEPPAGAPKEEKVEKAEPVAALAEETDSSATAAAATAPAKDAPAEPPAVPATKDASSAPPAPASSSPSPPPAAASVQPLAPAVSTSPPPQPPPAGQSAQGSGEGKSGGAAAVAPVAPATVPAILEQLKLLWSARQDMAENEPWRVLDQPFAWNAFQQKLFQAERFLLAGELAQARTALAGADADRRKLSSESVATDSPRWSIGHFGAASDKDPLAAAGPILQAAADQPSPDAQKGLEKSRLAEAGLFRMLWKHFREGESWRDPALARAAFDRRKQGDLAARFEVPELLGILEGSIEDGDRLRRRGDVSLIVRRDADANSAYRDAELAYSRSLEQAAAMRRSLQAVLLAALDVPYFINWLSLDLPDSGEISRNLGELDDFCRALERFAAGPSADTLTTVAESAETLKSSARTYADGVQRHSAHRQTWAALRVPFLAPEQRTRLLRLLLDQDPNPIEFDSSRSLGSVNESRPANPYPLAAYCAALDPPEPDSELLEQLRKFDPGAATELVRFKDLVANAGLREERSALGRDLLKVFRALRSPSGSRALASDGIERNALPEELSLALISAVLVADPRDVAQADERFRSLRAEARAAYVGWLEDRLLADDGSLPESYFAQTARLIAPERTTGERRAKWSLGGSRTIELPATGGNTKVVLELVPPRQIAAARNAAATLVVDWAAEAKPLTVQAAGAKAGDRRLEIPIAKFTPGKAVSVPLELRGAANQDSGAARQLRAWVERDGAYDWLDLRVSNQAIEKKKAEINYQFTNRAGRDDVIDLFPGQRLPITFTVTKNVPENLGLRLEILSRDGIIVWPLTEPETAGPVPIAPTASASIPIVEEGLPIRLMSGNTVLDEKVVEVAALDPESFLRANVTYDPDADERRVKADIEVLQESDAAGEGTAPLELSINLPAVDPIKLKGSLKDKLRAKKGEIAHIWADLPPGAPDRDVLAEISLVGFPRAFRYRVGSDRPIGVPDERMSLQITSPRRDARFGARPAVDLGIQVDGPQRSTFPVGIKAGIDDNEMGQFDSEDDTVTGSFDSWRYVRLRLEASKGMPELSVAAAAEDITVPIDTSGRQGPHVFRVEATGPDNDRKVEEVKVYFLTKPPQVVIDQPRTNENVPVGSPEAKLNLVLRAEDANLAPTIDFLILGIAKNANDKIDDDEKLELPPLPSPLFGSNKSVKLAIPTETIKTGPFTLLAQVVTKVEADPAAAPPPKQGQPPGEPKPESVERVSPLIRLPLRGVPATDSPVMAKNGTIVGVVMRAGSPRSGIMVTGIAGKEAKTDPKGSFRIVDVPPGMYTLKAKESIASGEVPVTVAAGAEANVTLELKIGN